MQRIQKAFLIIFIAIFAAVPSIASGVDPSGFSMGVTEAAVPSLQNESIFETISIVMNWLLGLIGVLAVIAFVISGILYLTSSGDEKQAEKAKSVMTYAATGLVVALIGLIVVNAIGGLTGADGGLLPY